MLCGVRGREEPRAPLPLPSPPSLNSSSYDESMRYVFFIDDAPPPLNARMLLMMENAANANATMLSLKATMMQLDDV